jgi:ABC-type Fe3+-hydroxamate transport system substrate-binding protein
MKPLRIISLVPSQTELLYYLGVPPIAQTIFCVHPSEAFKASVKIGGTKKLNIQKILDLQPDLVIGNIEENEKSQIELLQQNVKVWMTDIYTFDDALESITTIGEWVNKPQEALMLKNKIEKAFEHLANLPKTATVLYLIWKNPYMAVGRNTFINSMLQKAGFVNSIQAPESRYPELDITDIIALNPDRIFLSSEPYPFKKEDFLALQNALPHTQIQMVDGEQFSWYGNRMLLAADYFTQL